MRKRRATRGTRPTRRSSVVPHAPVQTHWEDAFQQFLAWLAVNGQTTATAGLAPGAEFIIRLTTTVRSRAFSLARSYRANIRVQIQYGRLCGTMEYSGVRSAQGCHFTAVPTGSARASGYTDRSAFKNYRCAAHQLYFQIDHFTVTIDRPT